MATIVDLPADRVGGAAGPDPESRNQATNEVQTISGLELTVVIPTHDPDPGRLRRALLGLRVQTLPADHWETLVVNNASSRFPDAGFFAAFGPANLRSESEGVLGLAAARARGFASARGRFLVLVDDDNVLGPEYLADVVRIFADNPAVGAIGGPSTPEFELAPQPWQREFLPLLALRDLGASPLISKGLRPSGSRRNEYPTFSPIGAGMALRREAAAAWLGSRSARQPTDRRGGDLASGGDNDIVLTVMKSRWEVAYFPQLKLTHLIPACRLDPGYLGRLNYGIQKSWMQVLALHDANPWPTLSPGGAALRKARAWLGHRAWSSKASRIRWQGACGHFDGRLPLK
jgi:glycosyltransferase involved in cell wall biosynthesis